MSWSSKALSWLIPSLFLTASINGNIIVISPWIENVNLQIYNWKGSYMLQGDTPLTDVILWLYKEYNIHFIFYVRDDQLQPSMNWRLERIYNKVKNITDFHGIPNLHAKMIVTDTNILETTANLLTSSIYRNVETTNLFSNPDGEAINFAKNFFTRHGLLVP